MLSHLMRWSAIVPTFGERTSGVLLHPTSLPGPFGIGDLGAAAYRFVDFLVGSRQRLWQVLPLGPTGPTGSPYDALSAFAGSRALVTLEPLAEIGLLKATEVAETVFSGDPSRADFIWASAQKDRLLRRAFERFEQSRSAELRARVERFVEREADWLDDYALFCSARMAHDGLPWYEWDPGLAGRDPCSLHDWAERLADEIRFQRFQQFVFDEQWSGLRRYANDRGIRIVGDIPIYVAHDSADVWAHQEIFTLDPAGLPSRRAGVPPDLFSATGQLWGNPCYRWDVLAGSGFRWWVDRFRHALERFDVMRIDHFRGFEAGWQVAAGEPTAINGEWVPGPGVELFRQVEACLGRLPIIVEDLGIITPEVDALRVALGYPGMRVLQFAFGGDADNPYLPHRYDRNTVVYTGTHDNDTIVGWFRAAPERERYHARRYLGSGGAEINWELIRAALMSVADTAIIPLQDLLGLDGSARMNTPGTVDGNWSWRFLESDTTEQIAARLAQLTRLSGRA